MTAISSQLTLPPLAEQIERLISLGVAKNADLRPEDLRALVTDSSHPGLLILPDVDPRVLAPRVSLDGLPGFVVEDLGDLPAFSPFNLEVPEAHAYLVTDLERGDEYSNETPNETYPKLKERDRTPITVLEGLFWALQVPEILERNRCFMTTGSRLRKADGKLDARTPALWISNGTGRDGKERRGAPKVGWCWAGNRHTWLGIASAADRKSLESPNS